jgi:hypothetical protein
VADLSDVLHALRDTIASLLYPNGVPAGSAPVSAGGVPARIYIGWPGADLDPDLKAGIAHLTIFPRPGMARSLNPYLTGWASVPITTPSLTASVSSETVTFGGTGAVPGMIAAVIVDGADAYTYPLATGDGPAEVAAALAAQIAEGRSVLSASGASLDNGSSHLDSGLFRLDGVGGAAGALSVPGAFSLVARVVSGGTERKEIRRLVQSVQISAWTSSLTARDALIRIIDDAFADEMRTLDLPDGTKATLTYEGTVYDEDARAQPLHRRDLILGVEYSQTRTRSAPGIAVPSTDITPEPARITRTVLS